MWATDPDERPTMDEAAAEILGWRPFGEAEDEAFCAFLRENPGLDAENGRGRL
jgi:hypothetical protein